MDSLVDERADARMDDDGLDTIGRKVRNVADFHDLVGAHAPWLSWRGRAGASTDQTLWECWFVGPVLAYLTLQTRRRVGGGKLRAPRVRAGHTCRV